ncbi:hypothetical protein DRJ00_02765, partial [Candidatus Aerophobetes bacterium]
SLLRNNPLQYRSLSLLRYAGGKLIYFQQGRQRAKRALEERFRRKIPSNTGLLPPSKTSSIFHPSPFTLNSSPFTLHLSLHPSLLTLHS